MLVAARRGIPVVLHTPSEVKAAITGSGRADKAQVTAMVTRILRLDTPPKPADAADALALAICHVWRGGITDRYESARLSSAADAAVQRQRAALRRSRSAATLSRSTSPTVGRAVTDNPANLPAQPPINGTTASARRVS
jgi:crossover junction endodeoxyribonuclease RuvC